MIISQKQQEANRQNAQHSTGPITPEGKAAVRLNALTYGLRARSTLIPGEDPEEYKQLWDELSAEWQPQTRTERLHLEQMATDQWLLARIARGESQIFEAGIELKEKFVLLNYASTYRVRLERSFTSALHQLKLAQKERQARQRQQAQTAKAVQAEHAAPHPDYAMSATTESHPAFGSPITPDTR
jgi:uncharacterized protein YhaN